MIKRPAAARSFATVLVVIGMMYSALLHRSSAAMAQDAAGAGTSKLTAATVSPSSRSSARSQTSESSQTSLAQFSWLTGYWHGNWGPRIAQQVWMAPHSGVMVGAFELSEDGRALVIELYTIASTPNGIELRVRHFTPLLTPWEKSGPAVLSLKSIDSKTILFENKASGQPKRWTMRRTGADSFIARFEIVAQKGQQQVAEITYHRDNGTASDKK